jgi:hypothetical protein
MCREQLKVGGLRLKRETVNRALQEFIDVRERTKILFGKLEWSDAFDDERARR